MPCLSGRAFLSLGLPGCCSGSGPAVIRSLFPWPSIPALVRSPCQTVPDSQTSSPGCDLHRRSTTSPLSPSLSPAFLRDLPHPSSTPLPSTFDLNPFTTFSPAAHSRATSSFARRIVSSQDWGGARARPIPSPLCIASTRRCPWRDPLNQNTVRLDQIVSAANLHARLWAVVGV